MTTNVDAVIIGAGHNSLACACHLAARGWRVAVYEQAGEPGGAVKSGAYTQPGFRHDWAAMNLSLFAGSAFHTDHGEELYAMGWALRPRRTLLRACFRTGVGWAFQMTAR